MTRFWPALVAIALLSGPVRSACAQKKFEGFDEVLESRATGAELTAQTNLWILEVRFKPMRMVRVELTDPKTGEKRRKLVWYLAYQAVNRPLEQRVDTSGRRPVNASNLPPIKPLFVPEFTLVTNDNDRVETYDDAVLPEVQAAIAKKEGKRFANSVGVIQPVPEAIPQGEPEPEAGVIEGVAVFPNVDPRTDYFTVIMSGFSNGYRTTSGPDGEPIVLRKTIVQRYWRPGDEFSQNEREFRRQGPPRWIYRPDSPEDPLAGVAEPDTDAETDEDADVAN